MNKNKPTYDVFVSHRKQDSHIAADITQTLRAYGLVVYDDADIEPDERIEDALWEAMAESQALIIVASEGEPSAWTSFELGAAKAWNKSVYVVVDDASSPRLNLTLHGLPLFPRSRIEDLAREIKNTMRSFSDSELSMLVDEYKRIGEPVDHLVLRPSLLTKLSKQFNKRAKRQTAPEELVRTLLRLRKRGDLPALTKRSRPKVS